MLSYQHSYHAGNFADVLKHVTLTRLLDYMTKKDKGLFYLETHSGRGLYDLKGPHALKTGEAKAGIERLWQEKALPPVFSNYLQLIGNLNADGDLRAYPGSPEIAIQMLRKQDRLFFSELHSGEFEQLSQLSKRGKRVVYSNTDGLSDLNALLPPSERRGLVFIDPTYEVKTEYRDIPKLLKKSYKHFTGGTYCLWYPLVDKKHHEQLLRGLGGIETNDYLRCEFYQSTHPGLGMTGCGLWIINPPYVLADELHAINKVLCKLFNPGKSSYLIEKSPT